MITVIRVVGIVYCTDSAETCTGCNYGQVNLTCPASDVIVVDQTLTSLGTFFNNYQCDDEPVCTDNSSANSLVS